MILSKGDELYRVTLTETGKKFPKIDVSIRDAELGLLSSCIEQSANEAAKIPELKQRMRMLDELGALTDTDNYLDLTKSDIDLIRQSFEKLSGKRPPVWLRCYDLLEQLENPAKLKDVIAAGNTKENQESAGNS